MGESARIGLRVLAAAIITGILGDALLRGSSPGLGTALWITSVAAALLLLARQERISPAGEGAWLLAPVLMLALAIVWRDSPALVLMDLLGIAACLALVAVYFRDGSLRCSGLFAYGLHSLLAAIQTLKGLLPILFIDLPWRELPRGPRSAPTVAVLRGLLIAVPLLLVFGRLLISADAVFADLTARLFDLDLDRALSHLLLIGACAWIAGGFLRTALLGRIRLVGASERPAALVIGAVETGIALGLLNLLFGAFVLVQLRYFFGGAEVVQATTHLTYAEYARHGFFELVGVTALVLPLLLVGHWLQPPGDQRLFRVLAALLLGFLAVIMTSAVQRMMLYIQEFGLTELRVYATAGMAWLGLLLLWFAATVLRGRRDQFAFGALVCGIAVVLALHTLNPDLLIARSQLARVEAGRSLDLPHLLSLSGDALPLLMAQLPILPPDDRRAVAEAVLWRWSPDRAPAWRSWNWSRSRAYAIIKEHAEDLKVMAVMP